MSFFTHYLQNLSVRAVIWHQSLIKFYSPELSKGSLSYNWK